MARINLADIGLNIANAIQNGKKLLTNLNEVSRTVEKSLKPAIDNFEKQLNSASKNSRAFGQELAVAGKATDAMSRKADELFKSLQRINSGFRQTGQAVFAFAAVLSILAVPKIRQALEGLVSVTIDYQDSLVRTAKTAGLYITAQEEMAAGGDGLTRNIETLDKSLRGLAEIVAVPTEELAKMAAIAGQAGADTVAEIENLTGAAAIFSTITGVAGETAVESLATILAAFGKLNEEGIKDIDNLINTINRLENATVASAQDITVALLDASGQAAQLGVAEADLIGFAAFLKQTGLQADEAGTALRELFRIMTRKSADVAKLLDMSQEEFFARMDQPGGTIDVILMVADALGKVESNTEAAGIASQIFDIRATKALDKVRNNTDEFVRILGISREEWVNGTSAIDEYSTSLRSLRAQWVILENRVKNVAVAFAKDLQPAAEQVIAFLVALTDELGKILATVSVRTKIMAVSFAAAFVVIAPLLTIVGSLIFAFGLFLNGITNLVAGLGILGSGFGGIIAVAGVLLFIFRDKIPDAINYLASLLRDLADIFSDLANDALVWGTNVIAAFAEGMIDAINTYVIPAINSIVSIISDFLEGRSPPKKGPLSRIMEWGANVFSAYLRGFALADFDLLSKVGRVIEKRIRDLVDLGDLGEKQGFELLKQLREDVAKGIAAFRDTGQFPQQIFTELENTLGDIGKELTTLIKQQLRYNTLVKELDALENKRRGVLRNFREEARAIENNTSLTASQKAAALAALRARRNAELDAVEEQQEVKQQEKDRYETLIQFQERLIDALQEQDSVFVDIAKSIKDLNKSLKRARAGTKSDRLDDLMEELRILQQLKKQYEAAGLDILPLLREEVTLRKRIAEEQISRGMDPSGQIAAIDALEKQIDKLEKKAKEAKDDAIPSLGSEIEGLGAIEDAAADSTETLRDAIENMRAKGIGFFGTIDKMRRAVQAFFLALFKPNIGSTALELQVSSFDDFDKKLYNIGQRIRGIYDSFQKARDTVNGFFTDASNAAKKALGPVEAFRKGLKGEELDLLPAEKLAKMKEAPGILRLYNAGLAVSNRLTDTFSGKMSNLGSVIDELKKKFNDNKDAVLKAAVGLFVFLDAIAVLRVGGLNLKGVLTGLASRHGALAKIITANNGVFTKLASRIIVVYWWFINLLKTSPNKMFKTLRGTLSGFVGVLDKLVGRILNIGGASGMFAIFSKEFGGFVRLLGRGANVIPVDIGMKLVRGMNFKGMANFFAMSFGSNLIGALSAVLLSISKILPSRIAPIFERLAFSIGAQGLVRSLTDLFSRAFGKLAIAGMLKKKLVSGILSGMASIGITDLDRGLGRVISGFLIRLLNTSVIGTITSAFTGLIGTLSGLFGQLILGVLTPVIGSFVTLGAAIAGPIILITGIVGTLAGIILYLAENMDLVIKRISEFVQNFLKAAGLGVETADGFRVSFEGISETLGRLKDGLLPILALFVGLGKIVGAFIVNILPGLGTALGGVVKGLLEGVTLIISIVGGVLRIIGAIGKAIQEGDPSILIEVYEEVARDVLLALEGLLEGALLVLQGVFDAIVRGAVGMIAEILNLLGFEPEQVDAFIQWGDDVIDTMIQIGKDIVGGLRDGIKSAISKLWSVIKGIALGLIETIANIIGWSSPAKKFVEMGEGIVEGLIEGIKGMLGTLWSILRFMFKGLVDNILQFGKEHAPNLTQAIVGFVWTAIRWLRTTGLPLLLRIMTVVPALLIRGFILFRDKILPILISVFEWLSTKGLELAKRLFNWLRDTAIPILRDLAIKAIESFDRGFGFLQENVFPILKKVFNWLRDVAIPRVKEVAESIITHIGEAIDWLRTNWDSIKTRILGVWDSIRTKVMGVLDEWLPKFQELWSKIKEIVGLVLAIYYQGFMLISGLILDAIQGFITKFQELWDKTESVRNKIRDILNTGINYIKEKLLGFLGDWIGDNEEIEEITVGIKDAIRNLLDRGIDYIKQGVEDFFDDFLDWLGDVIDHLEDALDLLRSLNSERNDGGGSGGYGENQSAPGGAKGGILFHRAGQNQGMLLRVAERENEYLIPESELENFFSNYTGTIKSSTGSRMGNEIHLHMHNPIVREESDIKRIVKELKRELLLEIKR